ncbi:MULTISPECIES: hypothetical protein [unclassified Streptomyces]|uniref:hypothetical protein n=1 Tax=unclassified Streptomyces TaxID=2593676 RepID=UPI002E8062C0|nr:hypothetical protein [Streptomyces sp. NBC_00589]WTI43003.1 hypothetical protein OIC96_48450 [Streptomyces sp. NBC_00775]WUB33369.1 hypothetical protein OHA51_01270 [Streptomyces sp. NBC_00589]
MQISTGSLRATLAASKPGGHLVELGTGVGAGAAWLLHGMHPDARLISIEADEAVQAIATKRLAADPGVTFETTDEDQWLDTYEGPGLALAYVDCRPGKFHLAFGQGARSFRAGVNARSRVAGQGKPDRRRGDPAFRER